jgi:hypothetical protein
MTKIFIASSRWNECIEALVLFLAGTAGCMHDWSAISTKAEARGDSRQISLDHGAINSDRVVAFNQ